MRTVNVVEKNIIEDEKGPVAIVAKTATEVLKDISGVDFCAIEYSGRYIQNLTGSELFYAFGRDCNDQDYNGVMADRQQLDCSNHGMSVSVYSVAGGGTVARTSLRRKDLTEHQTMKPSYQLQ